MAKYSADIEIAVRGGQQVDGLIKNLNRLNNSINVVNRNAKLLEGKGFNVASMENYSRAVLKAENAIRKAAQGTQQEEQAVKALVTAMDAENKARARRNFLIAQEVASRRQVIATANAGFGMQGPQAATIRAGRGPASPIRGTANMPGSPAALAAAAGGGVQGGRGISGRLGGAISGSIIGGAFPLLFGQGGGAAAGGAIGGLVGGLAGPGGSFAGSLLGTLLGDIASRGQAVKQLAEDIGFSAQQTKQLSDAFKVANTDVEKFTAVVQNIRGVGLEIEDQAKAIQLVTRLTELYGGSFEKTGNAITSALEAGKVTQAILNQLTSQGINIQQALADKYNVNRDAILKMAKDGKISVQDLVDTLVDLGNKTDVTAKKQQNVFQDAYQQITDAAVEAAKVAAASFSQTGDALNQVATNTQNVFTEMFRELVRGTTEFILGLGEIARITGSVLDGVTAKFVEIQYGIMGAVSSLPALDSGIIEFAKNALAVLNPVGALIDKIRGAGRGRPQQFGPEPPPVTPAQIAGFRVPSQAAPSGRAAAKGPKPPEDRTADLMDDLTAMKLISTTQDGIRDALFQGNKALAIRLEYDQKVYDIQRDTAKALRDANYESERTAIRAQQIVRIKDAQLVQEDALRDLVKEQAELLNQATPLEAIQQEIDLLAAKLTGKEQEYLRQKAINDLVAQGVVLEDAIAQVDTQKALNNALEETLRMEQLIGTIGQGVGNALMSVFDSLITKAEDFNDVLRNTFAALGRLLLTAGLNVLADVGDPSGQGTGILSFLGFGKGFGKRAAGGPVTSQLPYVVGERGPELFVPNTGGSVVNTTDLRTAMGTRAGSAGAPVLNMSFETTNIGGVEYVSRDQLEAAMAATRRDAARDGAKRGMSMTLDKLQQSPGTRGRVGLR